MRSRLVIADSVRTAAGLSGNAVLVRDGRVEAIGEAEELRSAHLPECRYPGSVITPGLVDAHFHPLGYTAALMRLNLDKARNMEDLRELVGQASADLAPATALVGTRFDDQSIGRMPTRLDLDEAAGSRPVVIYRYCGHVAVASTAALELASITSNTRDPVGGSIDRDDRGNPTGVLRETAIALVDGPFGSRTGDLTPSELLARW